MFRHILSAAAAAVLTLGPGAASAQEIDFGSELNRTWWNGVTPAELKELTEEAGAQFIDLPDEADVVVSQIRFQNLVDPVTVRLVDCLPVERPLAERNCGSMVMFMEGIPAPSDMSAYTVYSSAWITTTLIDDKVRMHRLEVLKYGTTRGHVLTTLFMFAADAQSNLAIMDQIDEGADW